MWGPSATWGDLRKLHEEMKDQPFASSLDWLVSGDVVDTGLPDSALLFQERLPNGHEGLKTMPDMTPVERSRRKSQLLEELGNIHYGWVDTHKDNIDFQPARDSEPHDGTESDYALHSLDRSATAAQEEDWARRTAHILEELKSL